MEQILGMQKRLWAEINIDAVEYNYSRIGFPCCCVVKANAYGHGAVELSKVYQNLGAHYLAVSNIEEAIQLRINGIKIPILILGYTPVECVGLLCEYDIEQTVYNIEYATKLNDECIRKDITLKIHLKIDTGMGRIGFRYHRNHNELSDALFACTMSNLIPIGIFTHFSSSDEGRNDYTNLQFDFFKKAIDFLKDNGVSFCVRHCSNSAAIIDYPEFKLDMVRAGLILYGINPTNNEKFKLKPVLSLFSIISNIKKVKKGDFISYGRTFVADKDFIIATIPVGYADGFWRSNQNQFVYINGEYCRIVGRVCMDQIMVECKNGKIGDLVEIYGDHIPITDVANRNGTIPYEITCSLGERVPRVYKKDGKIVCVVDKIVPNVTKNI